MTATVAEELRFNFALSPEQRAIQETAREFARGEVDPIVDRCDELQEFPRAVIAKAGELGFLGVIFPEEYGGAGLGYVEYVLVVTELSKIDPSVGISVAAHNSLGTNHIYKFGNDEQRRRWVPPLASGAKIAGWALTEAGSGSDAAAARTQARKVDGGWVLNGSKVFCTHGSVGDTFVVLAITDPEGHKGRNMSAFVVEKGTPGFRSGKKENKLGIRASDTAELVLEDCLVPDENLLGAAGEGFKQALAILDGGRISIAALGLGTAMGAFDCARKYALEREQFGKPIASFQLIQDKLSNMVADITGMQLMCLRMAQLQDQKLVRLEHAALAKLNTAAGARRVCAMARDILGGNGILLDHHVARHHADMEAVYTYEGTDTVQSLIVGRAVTGISAFA
jgi:alkylation response protein AidB-like acyl-CoA dehydrogenase